MESGTENEHVRSSLLIGVVLLAGCGFGLADPALVTAPLQVADAGVAQADAGVVVEADAGVDAGPVDAGQAGGSDAGTPPLDAGVDPCAGVTCPATGARCERSLARCGCGPGFTGDGTSCAPVAPGTPATRTSAEVCTAWRAANTRREPGDGFTVSAATCDPGRLSRGALDDALARLNFFRWLAGLGPTADDASANTTGQACAVVSAWNPAGPAAHFPQSTATCYSPAGAGAAGSSNIAWGARDAADAVDLWMIDFGFET